MILVVVILLMMVVTGGVNAKTKVYYSIRQCVILEHPSGKAPQKANQNNEFNKGVEAEHLRSLISIPHNLTRKRSYQRIF